MKVEGVSAYDSFASSQKSMTAAEEVERDSKETGLSLAAVEANEDKQPAEEILSKIKDITEGGSYSVHFEKDRDTDGIVVRLVDQESGEVKRQIPSEELLQLSERLEEWRGNIVDTES